MEGVFNVLSEEYKLIFSAAMLTIPCLWEAEYIVGLREPGETTGDDAFHELPNTTE